MIPTLFSSSIVYKYHNEECHSSTNLVSLSFLPSPLYSSLSSGLLPHRCLHSNDLCYRCWIQIDRPTLQIHWYTNSSLSYNWLIDPRRSIHWWWSYSHSQEWYGTNCRVQKPYVDWRRMIFDLSHFSVWFWMAIDLSVLHVLQCQFWNGEDLQWCDYLL